MKKDEKQYVDNCKRCGKKTDYHYPTCEHCGEKLD
jgi:ribosomal protein L37E